MKISRSAFTLIEILVVITIIGLISTAALVFLKDTTEVKALSYTKKVMDSIKIGVADSSSNRLVGFVNDFGAMPPQAHFLLGIQKENNSSFNFVGDRLVKYRFSSMSKQDGSIFPAPYMGDCSAGDDKCKDSLTEEVNRVLFVGFHGGYMSKIGDKKQESLYDGWNTPIALRNDLNISTNSSIAKSFFMLKSAGSDRSFDGVNNLVREEFDLAQDGNSLEDFYADDYNQTYRKGSFIVRSLDIDIGLDIDDANETAILVYSPMLYYVKGSENETCAELNTTHASCDSGSKEYMPYYPFDRTNAGLDAGIEDKNVSWHIGLMKQELYFNDNNESRLSINQGGIGGFNSYDFNSSNHNISDSIFFGNISVDINNTSYSSADVDIDNPFYMLAGTKIISIWSNNGSGWRKQESYAYDFRPNAREIIRSLGN